MRQPLEKTFTSFDGTSLFYRHWPAATGNSDRAIVLFHRGHEHGGRLQHIVDELQLPDMAMFAWDARGHGRTGGQPGYSPGIGTSIKDVDAFIRHINETYHIPVNNILIIAQSVGAVLISAWVHDYAPPVRGVILASPAFKVKLYVPLARFWLGLWYKIHGMFFVNSYVKAKYLTHDPARITSYNTDPLITRPIAVNILLALYDTANRIIADAGAITVPVQLLISGDDWVVHHAPQHRFFERLGSAVKEKHVLPGFYHDTLGELQRESAFAPMRRFIQERYADNRPPESLLAAHQAGYTYEEYRQLSRPLSPFAPKAWLFAMLRFGMATAGRLSAGVQLGITTGFDSGSTLDYVYRNTPTGWSPLGRMIDKSYLDAIGWRGIRVRKQNLEKLIGNAVARLQHDQQPVRIVDIAAGHGRYVLDAIKPLQSGIAHVQLRDYSELNVTHGRKLIAHLGLEKLARFDQGDAFDEASLANLDPKPTLTVISGVYELFADNALLNRSLAGLASAIEPGGYLVYTNQPWHPQLEFIARVLTSHRGNQAWVMRRRTQQEMDQLVAQAGFDKLDQLTDDWGIFTVSLARRR